MNKFSDVSALIKWVEKQRRFTPKAGLSKMEYFCSLFDHPEKKFTSIHVTGTNGKGSTVAYLTSILREAGLKVATFTSPYITIFNERICFDGKYISDEDLLKYSNMLLDRYDQIEKDGIELPTFFEFITMVAFLYFSNLNDLDIAIIEVGMGGRLDSTNVIESSVAVITNVAYDHMSVLGNTLEEIATEKLGIVKNNEPVVTGIKDKLLQNFFVNKLKDTSSEIYLTALTAFEIKKMDIYGSEFVLEGSNTTYQVGLAGIHQIENSIIAIKVIEILNKLFAGKKRNFPISNVILSRGLKNVSWPGRLEILNDNPLILTDGAHNIDGITRVCSFIKTLDYKSKRAIVAISKDKEKDDMINILDDTFDEIIFTNYSYERSSTPTELNELSHNKNHYFVNSIDDAIEIINNNKYEFNIFLGSLYLVSDVRKKFK